MGKSPVKLPFPTFGRLDDTPDRFQCLERCDSFLALNPLKDEELIATPLGMSTETRPLTGPGATFLKTVVLISSDLNGQLSVLEKLDFQLI